MPPVTPQELAGGNIAAGTTRTLESSYLITTTPRKVALVYPDRLTLLLINLGTQQIFIKSTPDVSPTSGILLVANGGYLNTRTWEDYDFTKLAFWAVTSALTSTLNVTEIVKDGG